MIQIRPRSSNVIATGLTMSGSLATSSTREALGHRHLRDRLGRRQRRAGRLVLGVRNHVGRIDSPKPVAKTVKPRAICRTRHGTVHRADAPGAKR